jgi:hypothetical protein
MTTNTDKSGRVHVINCDLQELECLQELHQWARSRFNNYTQTGETRRAEFFDKIERGFRCAIAKKIRAAISTQAEQTKNSTITK